MHRSPGVTQAGQPGRGSTTKTERYKEVVQKIKWLKTCKDKNDYCNLQLLMGYKRLYIKPGWSRDFWDVRLWWDYDLATNPWDYKWYWQHWFGCRHNHLKHVIVWSSVGAWHPKKQLETKRRSLQNLIAVCRCLWTGLAFEWGLLLNRACFWTLLFDFDDPFRHCGVTRGSRACGGRCEGFRTWILNIKTSTCLWCFQFRTVPKVP